MDFVKPATRYLRSGGVEVYPKFVVCPTKDLMIRGGTFYAMWNEKENRWTTDEYEVIDLIDNILKEKADEIGTQCVAWMWDSDSKSIDKWHNYCNKQQHDNWVMLDSKLVFDNEETAKEDYVTRKLPYSPIEGDISAYNELVTTLYSKTEREKIEWMIGSILSGDSRKNEKLYVFYGAPGTGKSTILKVVMMLFPGYCQGFRAKSLGDKNDSFALEQFKNNPLIAIDHDSNLSQINENSLLNALISHETVVVNEKHKSVYNAEFQSTLIIASNKPVKITDSKSGLIRRVIDINPSGNKLPKGKYMKLMSDIRYELGAIAYHCLNFYLNNKQLYDDYEPREMMALSNDFYDFMLNMYFDFSKTNETTLAYAYSEYIKYCTESNVQPMKKRDFKAELRSYFSEFYERVGDQWSVYKGFLKNKFGNSIDTIQEKKDIADDVWLKFEEQDSLFDKELGECKAQYATEDGKPKNKWDDVTTKLSDIDSKKIHYVKVPENHIVIDLDLTDDNGEKSLEENLKAALKFPETYAELSKSGKGVHLHYLYQGDPKKLSRIYDDKIEIKVFTGNASLRRKLSKCNNISIKPISGCLPIKGDLNVIKDSDIKNEQHLRCLIKKCLNKEYGSTVCNIDFIYKLLEDCYNKEGFCYDVSNMAASIYAFAANSTHQSQKCIKTYSKMHFKSKNYEDGEDQVKKIETNNKKPILFFDVEVFPNLFVVCWKEQGDKKPTHRMINPTPNEIKELCSFRLIGFNNRAYDNHMLYARILGYSEKEIYSLSHRMIKLGSKNSTFGPAYNLSYTDVYDFASAPHKMSLKKWEIKLGIHHQELGWDWDTPVPKSLWDKVCEYCENDVIATEAVFNELEEDWIARKMLAKAAKMTYNDTTNSITTKLIFGDDKNPQTQFNYRNLGEKDGTEQNFVITKDGKIYNNIGDPQYTLFRSDGKPVFPGYKFEFGHSEYRGEDPKEGGYVFSIPGIYYYVALLDIASMHPSSAIAEELFGEKYTKRFEELKKTRIYIKHGEFDKAAQMMGGIFSEFLTDPTAAKALSGALKTPINAMYGLTAAKFQNKFRDIRNVDNIVAKRGALFMINLKHEVANRGYTVAHIKTDSIKIPEANKEIIEFIMDYGKMYGYDFEHEATYEKMCLVNNSVYIAKYASIDWCKENYGYCPEDNEKAFNKNKLWTATGAEFAHPYIFKRLFSKEEICEKDYAETKEVTTNIYLDFNENDKENHNYSFVGKVGQFTPVKDGYGGGLLMKTALDKNGEIKYDAVVGSSGYRWLETEDLINRGLQDKIDKSYYEEIANKAIEHINSFGDYYEFVA